MFNDSEPIDLLTVTEALRKDGNLEFVGGAYAVANLTTRVASTANVEFHARIISQKYIQRELIRVSSNIIEKAFDEKTDVFDLLDEAESGLFEVAEGNIRKSFESMTSVVKKAIDYIDKARNNDSGVSGIPSGSSDLDKVTGGSAHFLEHIDTDLEGFYRLEDRIKYLKVDFQFIADVNLKF